MACKQSINWQIEIKFWECSQTEGIMKLAFELWLIYYSIDVAFSTHYRNQRAVNSNLNSYVSTFSTNSKFFIFIARFPQRNRKESKTVFHRNLSRYQTEVGTIYCLALIRNYSNPLWAEKSCEQPSTWVPDAVLYREKYICDTLPYHEINCELSAP